MKIAFFEVEKWERQYLSERLPGHELVFVDKPLTGATAAKAKGCDAVSVFIYSRITKQVLAKLPGLKLVATRSTGFDHVDIGYCKQEGITVCNVPTYGENTVAEHTFSLILALSRKLYPSIKRTREEGSFHTDDSLRGFDLKGKTLGVIGTGHIGQHVIRMAHGFQMDVLAHDRHHHTQLARKVGFRYASMEGLLRESDIVTVHVPLTEETRHLIDKSAIAKMKDGAILVNTSRGGIIDTHALVEGLHSGKLGGAGLDVLEEECEVKDEQEVLSEKFKKTCDMRTLLENHLLMKFDNVIITPHNAFNSREALRRILDTTVENIEAFDSGKPFNMVNSS